MLLLGRDAGGETMERECVDNHTHFHSKEFTQHLQICSQKHHVRLLCRGRRKTAPAVHYSLEQCICTVTRRFTSINTPVGGRIQLSHSLGSQDLYSCMTVKESSLLRQTVVDNGCDQRVRLCLFEIVKADDTTVPFIEVILKVQNRELLNPEGISQGEDPDAKSSGKSPQEDLFPCGPPKQKPCKDTIVGPRSDWSQQYS